VATKVHPSFERIVHDFVSGRKPGPQLTNFFSFQRTWLKEAAKKLDVPLRKLHDERLISPDAVLSILGDTMEKLGRSNDLAEVGEVYGRLVAIGATPTKRGVKNAKTNLKKKLLLRLRGARQKRYRTKDLRVIDDFLSLVETWRGIDLRLIVLGWKVPEFGVLRREILALRWIIEHIPGQRPNRPPELEMRRCARNLAAFFREVTGVPLYERIGEIMSLAFPKHWARTRWGGSVSRQQEIDRHTQLARKFIGKIPHAHNLIVREAISLQNGESDRIEYWSKETAALRKERTHTHQKETSQAQRGQPC